MKSDLMHAWTSGRRSSSEVPVVRVRSRGARTDGEGDGRDVRWGFCERAASSGVWLAGGVTNVMSGYLLALSKDIYSSINK